MGERISRVLTPRDCPTCHRAFTPYAKHPNQRFCSRRCFAGSTGHVFLRKVQPDFWDRFTPEPNTGCLIWTGPVDHHGYGVIGLSQERKHVRTHRLAWEKVNGPIPPGMDVLHRCDFPPCGLAEPDGKGHLFLGTARDNLRDAAAKGRTAFQRHAHVREAFARSGERHRNAKLSREDVVAIRRRRAAGERSNKTLAADYGVSVSLIEKVVSGEIWRDTTDDKGRDDDGS